MVTVVEGGFKKLGDEALGHSHAVFLRARVVALDLRRFEFPAARRRRRRRRKRERQRHGVRRLVADGDVH